MRRTLDYCNNSNNGNVVVDVVVFSFIYFGFLCPTLMTIFGSNPRLLLWFMDEYRPLEYPPRSDPTIINEIMNDRIPESSSIEA